MLTINEILQNRYRIVRHLGQGGMGAVYEAEDEKRFGKNIAVKQIMINPDEEPNLRKQEMLEQAFEREAKILAGLEHEAFPQVIDYFVERNHQFLVMELVPGDSLSKLLEIRRKPFLLQEVLDWADQLLDALDYLHTLENPIFHRDIKPQNLKLNSRGKIKLLDFGIAKATDSADGLGITNQTFIAATLHYSPLEQIIKAIDPNYRDYLEQKFGAQVTRAIADKTDARSDIYALGATLYHFLTNALPVDAMKRSIELFSGNPDPLPKPHQLNEQIPAAISEWILKAMEIEMEQRFNDIKQMQESLREILKSDSEIKENLNNDIWIREFEKLKLERESLEAERRQIEAERRFYLGKNKEEGVNFNDSGESKFNYDETFTDLNGNYDGETCNLLSEAATFMFNAGSFVILPVKEDIPPAYQKAEITDTDARAENQSLFSLTATSYLVGAEFESDKELKTENSLPAAETERFFVGDKPKTNRGQFTFAAALILTLLILSSAGAGFFYVKKTVADLNNSEIYLTAVSPINEPIVFPAFDFELPTADPEKVENQKPETIEPTLDKKPEKIAPPAKTPAPAKKVKPKKKRQNPCQIVTVDCIINDI